MCFSFKLFSSLINTFFTFNGPSYFSSGYVNYHAIVKFSFDFLAAAIPPSTSSVFPFGRQAKLQHSESTFKLWTGSSLSIDQIWNERRKKGGSMTSFLDRRVPIRQQISIEWIKFYSDPSAIWRGSQIFRRFVPFQVNYRTLQQMKSKMV